MKWKKFTLETTTDAVDYLGSMFDDIGIEGMEIEDNVPLTESETKGMFIDILPELPPDDGTARVSFYLDEDEDTEEKLKAVRKAIPKALRSNPNLRLVMSIDDFDKYDDELTERESKNASETDVNSKRYKGITIETLAAWPDDLIVATLCSPDADGNWFAAVNLQDDQDVIQIDKIANASELYFFKLLMKADTNIAFGEEMVVLDTRTSPAFKSSEKTLASDVNELSFKAAGESKEVTITASGEYSVSAAPAGFTVVSTDDGLKVTAEKNTGGKAKAGNLVVTLDSDKTKKVTIALSQVATDVEAGG